MAQWNGKYKIFFDEEELKSLQLCSESLDLQNVCQDFSEDLQRKSVCKETCSSSYPQGFNVHAAEFWPRQSTGSDETHTSSRPITSARGQHTDLPVSYAAFDYIKSPVSQVKEAKLEKPLSRFSPLSVHRAGSSVLGQERVSVPLNTTRDTPTSVPVVPIDKVILSPRYFLADSRVTSDYSVHDTSDTNLLTRNQLETQTLKSVLSRTGERNHPLTTRIGHASYILPTVPVCGTRRSNLDTKTQAVHISSSLPTVCDTVCSQPRRDIKVLQPVMGASQQRLVRDRKDSSFSLSPSDYYTTSLQLPRVSHRTSSLQTARDTNVPQQERLPTIPMSVSANAENVRFRTPLSDCSMVAFGTGSGEPMVEIPTMPSPWLSPVAIDSKDQPDNSASLQNLCMLMELNARMSLQQECVADASNGPYAASGVPELQDGPGPCQFCKRNGERRTMFMSHRLKNAYGVVTCPILRRYVCPICDATGDNAHTVGYCPEGPGIATISAAQTHRKSCGCVRHCRHGNLKHH